MSVIVKDLWILISNKPSRFILATMGETMIMNTKKGIKMGPTIGGFPERKEAKAKFLLEIINNKSYDSYIRQTARTALDGLGVSEPDVESYEGGRKYIDESVDVIISNCVVTISNSNSSCTFNIFT